MTGNTPAGRPYPHGLAALTVGATLFDAADRFPDRTALIYGDRRTTWRGLADEAVQVARSLLALGVRPGEHVGVLMPNCHEYIALYLAIDLVGATAVLLNARYRSDDLAYVIPKADVDVLFVGGQAREHCDYRPLLAEALPGIDTPLADGKPGAVNLKEAPRLRYVVELGDDRSGPWLDTDSFEKLGAACTAEDVMRRARSVTPDAVGMMMFSSGTTSRPKACMLTHRTLSVTGSALAERFRLTEEDSIWDPLPLFHMSTMLPFAACRASGACFIGMNHFDPDEAMELLIAEQPTVHYAGFPAIIAGLIDHPDFKRYDQSRLRINHVVGPPDLLRRYAGFFPGAVPVNSYGLTEATGVPCYSDLNDERELLFETNGFLFDGMAAKIVDADGNTVKDGDPGEICLKGNTIFAGYYADESATRAALDAAGWLHTGDRGRIGPDGRLIYEGRIKDMLKIGGENVAAVELESFLMTHPGVRMAQVVGVPDERLMEVACAFIERQPGHQIEENDIVEHCRGKIASYKIPRYVRFVDEWPMSATKVQKFKLLQEFEPVGRIEPASSK